MNNEGSINEFLASLQNQGIIRSYVVNPDGSFQFVSLCPQPWVEPFPLKDPNHGF